ncbi:phosphoribosyl-ATP pyrophosphohydrolase [Acidaminobacter sp. JC074]|uniref:nucleoside triphosphate pyrophosphohydrolase n=1 Tax=Acidaminobacter sp. JC074 TaxID=2530199 RepID=UPI001F0EA586|nr:nucleoside triphosphate pyrophosphohydrolase [Acidaminobacter sp. JC074]MCH4886327.1 phosphoribosyl-ATP pyrophosphohydrolase [Acidaminobacter sp. JC074]
MKNKTKHNKLVRDKIPAIIEKSGRKSKTYIADTNEYKNRLLDKLLEEVHEFKEEPNIEELADIMEVIETIKSAYDFNNDEINEVRSAKAENRGAFKNKIILEYVYED